MPDGYRLHRGLAGDLDATTLYRILRLRVDVFVVEQACPYPELDGRDLEPTTRHLWFTDAEPQTRTRTDADAAVDVSPVAATLRLMEDGRGADGEPEFRIGRVCTERAHRGNRLAAHLLRSALDEVGDRMCRIEAQTYLCTMYARFGFRAVGEEYLEDGIPHVTMVRGGTVTATGRQG